MVSSDSANEIVTPLLRYRQQTMRSNAWLSGRNDNASSSSVTAITESEARMLLTMFPWLSITPFGSPVVPEV